jgi:hypothetical protein
VTELRGLLREIAVPRPTGSVAVATVMETLRRELWARDFTVATQRFDASPAGLHAVAVGAFVLAGTAVAVLVLGTDPWAPAAATVGIGAALFVVLLGSPVRRPLLRALARQPTRGVNLIATRAGIAPRVWLVAHYDGKGQWLSMAGRLIAGTGAAVGGAGLVVLAAAAWAGVAPPPGWWVAAAMLGFLGAVPLTLNGLPRSSSGAVDNATGLVTALGVADRLPPDAPVGILFLDAEEWGLLGARVLACEQPELLRDTAVINFDGIDDTGATIALAHRPGPLGAALSAALHARRARRLPVVVDGIALAPAARECVTIMRGGWRTMTVVHTTRDTAARLTLAGVEAVASAVAAVLRDRAVPR